MFFLAFAIFVSCTAKTLACGGEYSAEDCATAATSYPGYTGVLMTALTNTVNDITDLIILSKKNNDQFDFSTYTLSSLQNVKVIASTAITVAVTLPTGASLTSLDINTAIADFQTEVSSEKITFSGTTKGTLKAVSALSNKKVTLTADQIVDLADALSYYPVIIANSKKLSINVAINLSKDQSITIKPTGFIILGTELLIDNDHIAAEKYAFITTVTGSLKNLVFAADGAFNDEVTLSLPFGSLTNPFKVFFDSTWGTATFPKKPKINLIVHSKGDITIDKTPSEYAILTIKIIEEGYDLIAAQNVEFCLGSACVTSAPVGTLRIDTTKDELSNLLGAIHPSVQHLTLLFKTDASDITLDSLTVESEIELTLQGDDNTNPTEISIKKAPLVAYSWNLVWATVTIQETKINIKTLQLDANSGITPTKNILIDLCIGAPTDCEDFTYTTYKYKGSSISLDSDDCIINFDEKKFLINPNTVIDLKTIKATKVIIELELTKTTGTKGIKFIPSGTKAEDLTLSIKSFSGNDLPITFDTWTAVESEISVDIIVPKADALKVKVNDTPNSKVTMVLKDDSEPPLMYDMKPLTATSYEICIDADNTKCNLLIENIKEDNLLFTFFQTITEAIAFISSLPTNTINLYIGCGIDIPSTSPLNLSKFNGNISTMSFIGLKSTENPARSTEVSIKSPKETSYINKLNLNFVNLKVSAEENKKIEIIDIELITATISGQYHIQRNEFLLRNAENIEGGIISDRIFIETNFDGPSSLEFEDTKWTYIVDKETPVKTSISPGNETFKSDAIFLTLIHINNGNFTLKPKDENIQKAKTLTIYIKEKQTEELSRKEKQPRSLTKKLTGVKTDQIEPSKININFDEKWSKVNLTERFTIRVIGEEKLVSLDQANVNSKFINIVESETLPPPDKDKNELDPTPKTPVPKSKGLSTGAIVGIVIGCIAVVAGIVVGVVFALKKKKSQVTGGSASP